MPIEFLSSSARRFLVRFVAHTPIEHEIGVSVEGLDEHSRLAIGSKLREHATVVLREMLPMSQLKSVDRIEIQVLVDNVTDSLSSTPPSVTREWSLLQSHGMRLITGGALCCANHGLSLLITAHDASGSRSLLFDGGPVDYAIERNGMRMGADFGSVDAVMLSHGHWDHAGGLPRAFGMIQSENGDKSVPLYLHPGMFDLRGVRRPDGSVLPMERVLSPSEWSLLGADPVVTTDAQFCLDDTFYISGEIPRITPYEKGFPEHVRQRPDDGVWVPDTLLVDERFLVVQVRNKGLVIFSACSHAGIVNVLHHARNTFPGIKIHAIMGGFHLSGTTEVTIPATVSDMGTFDLELVIPAHCTGWRAVNALERAFGEGVVMPSAVGKRFTV